MSDKGNNDDEGQQLNPDEVLLLMFDLMEAQGSAFLAEHLRHEHQVRGARLFALMRLVVVLPAFGQALSHCDELAESFAAQRDLAGLAFLVRRSRADLEISIDALLLGRQSVIADSMRDVMEIELMLRDFTARKDSIDAWLNADEKSSWNNFSPKEVRRRLANDLYPSKGFDLPEADEYAVHSAGLHPSPQPSPHREKEITDGVHDGHTLFEAGEIIEHAARFFTAAHALLEAVGARAPTTLDDLEHILAARGLGAEYTQQIKDRGGMTERGPRPRKVRDILRHRITQRHPDPDEGT